MAGSFATMLTLKYEEAQDQRATKQDGWKCRECGARYLHSIRQCPECTRGKFIEIELPKPRTSKFTSPETQQLIELIRRHDRPMSVTELAKITGREASKVSASLSKQTHIFVRAFQGAYCLHGMPVPPPETFAKARKENHKPSFEIVLSTLKNMGPLSIIGIAYRTGLSRRQVQSTLLANPKTFELDGLTWKVK